MISFQPHALPLRTPYRWAKGEQHVRRGVIVRVEIEGAAGFGEIAPPIHEAVDEESLAACAAALVEGLDIVAPSFLQDLDTRNVHPRIRSGIVTAWLSARASLHGVSLGRFLAGCSRLPAATVPINGLVTEAEPAAAAERVRSLLTEGYSTLKIKCTADRVGDIKRLDAIREVAPRARLRLDANESWPAEWSLEHLRTVAQFDIEYVEQPLPHDQTIEAFVRLRARSPIPIALDESACDLPTIQRILRAGAADALVLKAPRLGGPDRTLLAIEAAAAHGIPCTVTCSIESAVGVVAALHCASLHPTPIPASGLGTSRFLERDVAPCPPVVGGVMIVPTGPGLGLSRRDTGL